VLTETALRILVVEDCHEQARDLASLLHLNGYEVAVAHNGFTGLAAALSQRPDVVLCDVSLPLLDGLGVVQHVRRVGDGYRPLLVAVTARDTDGDRRRCLQAGFDHHHPKPLDTDRLLRLLRDYRPGGAREAAEPR
jgi:CheY-like chemotaxis protein